MKAPVALEIMHRLRTRRFIDFRIIFLKCYPLARSNFDAFYEPNTATRDLLYSGMKACSDCDMQNTYFFSPQLLIVREVPYNLN